ncbi:complex I subunit 5 family protein [Halomonas daqiaonensis]|uniref:Formate hydrogenlyase subunit 3/Multisubunit Na+/H+ antiporter, MnhD subunit n=1 Tax=Halomonas daqiaonensis TaxID=650850 RepID=A0A1H7W292_9GAMM|nr:complex I subunit 5 family protein [Halomonas daqiaonensis]SEM15434.1 Formate hydrogenlyase subunit 3/Multisubunit Na+/H+ antiporter, MnhD subunit [Halomonas daqiaonensis]
MSDVLLVLTLPAALLWPLLLMLRVPLVAALADRGQPRVPLDGPWCSAPLPALLLALGVDEGTLVIDWWLLGGHWALDGTRGPLLAFTALLWLLAGGYARGYLAGEQARAVAGDGAAEARLMRFALLWPLTLSGNLLLLVAEDIASFYMGFAVMTFAAYGLVVHSQARDARIGGLAYLVMAVLGEGLILAGLLWGAGSAGTTTLGGLREGMLDAPGGAWMGLLLWLGFGVKAGVIGLHFWLPLAHPVAPTPASAVLSGAMIKAGLVGWLFTLPLGESAAGEAFVWLGRTMLVTGLVAAIGAALYGVCQRHPKAVLAYSSISQMGMITALVAMGLVAPTLWPALSAAVVLFAAHHGLTKGALFLGVGIGEHPPRLPSWLLWTLLVLPALSLTGALASGLAGKWAFKAVLDDGGHPAVVTWLSLAAVGTTALMARTLWCQWQGERQARKEGLERLVSPMPLAWLATLLAALTLPWWLGGERFRLGWPPLAELPGLLWPLALGLLGSVVVWAVARRRPLRLPRRLPPGDLWWLLEKGWQRLRALGQGNLARLASAQGTWVAWWLERERDAIRALDGMTRAEGWLRHHAAVLMMGVAVGLALLMLFAPA